MWCEFQTFELIKEVQIWEANSNSGSVATQYFWIFILYNSNIQAQAIPAIMSGRDMIGIAKTGSGKTLAFLLPMFRHIADQEELEEGDGPIAIIMTPTRELCLQVRLS